MFLENKYKLWHDNIIAKAKNRLLEGYKEVHHIIPKSCGGSNDKDNLVILTAREHYIVHLLLIKFIEKKYYFKMIKAFHSMSLMKNKYVIRNFKINNRLFEKYKKEHSEYMKLNNPSFNDEIKKKISIAKKDKKMPLSFILKMRGKKLSQETKNKLSKSLIGNKRRLGVSIPLEQRIQQSKFMTGNKLNLGRKFTQEVKNKMSLAHKLRWFKIKESERRVA
jgi:hypothetical protein